MKMFQNRKWWWWVLWIESLVMVMGVFFVIIYSSTEMLPNGWDYVMRFYWPFLVLGVAEVITLLLGRGGPGSSLALFAVGVGRIIKIIYPSVLVNVFFFMDNINQSFLDNLATLETVATILERFFGIALIVLAIVWHKLQQPKPKKVLSV